MLIVRLSAIGDVIMATGLLPSLKQAYPSAEIDWLTEDGNADLLRHNPRVSRLHLWPRIRWRSLRANGRLADFFREATTLISTLRARRYDLVLDLQGLLKSAVWARLTGGRLRIGLGSSEGSGIFMHETVSRKVDSALIGKEYRRLAELLTGDARMYSIDIVVGEDDRKEVAHSRLRLEVPDRYAAIAPFTTRPQKHWLDHHWSELIGALSDQFNLPAVLLGAGKDRSRATAIARQARGRAIDLTGQTTLGQSAAWVEGTSLLIGVDTGLTHLGIGFGVPTIALFGSTRPYLDTGKTNARVLYSALECSPCRRRPVCGARFDCMRAHTPTSVLAATREILEYAKG